MLILVRHGQTGHNAAGLLVGRSDPPLNDRGRREAEALAQLPAIRGASRVVSSPLRRAVETAEALKLPMSIDERWLEIDYGIYEGRPVGEIPRAEWQAWRADTSLSAPGGESLADVGKRVQTACQSLMEDASAADIVIVSHVSPIKAAVAWSLGVGSEVVWRMYLDTTGLSRIGIGPDGPTLRSFNETAHRPG